MDVTQFIALLFTFQRTVASDREEFNCNKLVVKVSVSRRTKSDMSARSVDDSISLTKDISSICFADFPSLNPASKSVGSSLRKFISFPTDSVY